MDYTEIIRPYLNELSLDEPRKLVEALDICGSVSGVWGIRSLSGNRLRRYMSKRSREAAYFSFEIPKKSGGTRHICAPMAELKHIQQSLNLMLQTLCEPSAEATGFVPGRSVVTNAEMHLGQRVVFNCDLKNFFPSITKGMVRRTLTRELQSFKASRDVINIICNLVTMQREDGVEALPQGAPTSPVISNLVLKSLDNRLSRFAWMHGLQYSRYADDITFSHSHVWNTMLPEHIEIIFGIIADEGFKVNLRKTRIFTSNDRHEITGLTVSDKVNVSRKYVKQLRTLLHLWESLGLERAQEIYTRDFCQGVEADFVSVVNGKINYLCMIKGRHDSTYRRFKSRFRTLTKALKTNENKQYKNNEP